jgi:hypothetical protein
MASNTRTLIDDTGQYSDWIEIHNVSSDTVNLLNWSLTDSAGNLAKWRFPETNLAAGRFMVIFASSPERRVPGAPLHTGFALSASGEYLALVQPDGVIASEFAPAFPPQAPDVSFGLATLTTNLALITTNSAARVLIPANGNDGTNWTTTGFDDSAWTPGTNGVGYGTTNATAADYGATVLPTAPVGFWRMSEGSGTAVANSGSGAGLNGTATATATVAAGPRPPQFNGFEADNNARGFNGTSASVGVGSSLLNNRGAFTIGGWVRKAAAQAARTGLFGQNDCVEFGFISDGTLQCWTPGGGSIDAPVTLALNTWYHIVAVGNGSNLRIFTNGVLAASGGVATASYGSSANTFNIGGNGIFDATGNFFNGQLDEVVAYHRALTTNEIRALYDGGRFPASVPVTPFVKTDVAAAMSNVNASAYIRLPFTIDDPMNVALVTLRVRYDDGLAVFLNGVPVASANAPAEPAFDSAATNAHSPGVVEEFRLGPATLRAGANVLAIQGLNLSAANEDFLVLAELSATFLAAESPTPLYFTTPSPGADNVGGVANPGPAILDVNHSPNVPLDADDLVVTARIVPTFYSVASVVMRYRVMFSPEIEVTMFDDGAHGDGAAGDGVYGATIPASASMNGQMVRWYFRTTDIAGNTSRWPIFAAPASAAEYLGTVVNPGYVTSKLPIFHLFAPATVLQPPRISPQTQQIGADSEGGGRVSIFYDGEFYDNVYMELRGNTSAGQNKKSHRLEFNREHPFRHLDGFPRIRKTSFMAEFLDPAYIRQHLCFWLLDQMGVRAPFFYPVRAQLNGSFYGLVFHNDVIGQEQVQRMGFDPRGALYKAAGNVLISRSSTGVFQKLEPDGPPDYTDYNQLCNGIVETATIANRRIAAFDLLDVPQVINYLAGARWCAENDDVWANMSIYRDTFGDELWRVIPFDMNASWGQRYGGISPLDATLDTCKSHPLYGGSTIIACDGGSYNRIYDVVIAVPELRQMLLRRMRTVLDRWVLQPGVAPEARLLESHIRHMTNLIWTEAFLDRASWGYSTWTASNRPLTNAVNELFNEFINLRRPHWNGTHCVTNTAKPVGINRTDNAGIPVSQPVTAFIGLHSVEFSPSSGNQDQEFVCLTNTTGLGLEISGWKIEGAVNFTFAEGTVVPAFTAIYVSPNTKAFRARTTAPRGGQGLFVVGPYSGRLSARGESVRLVNHLGIQLQELAYAGSPSPSQQFLRVTEIMYNPSALAGNTNDAQEFEYLELRNISATQSINLTGVRFINGIEFDFTTSGLDNQILLPGRRVALVKNFAVFGARYGFNAPAVVGQYTGSLDNAGERLRLVDAAGEEILDFSYNNSWYPLTDGYGFSLVVVDENAEPDAWSSRSQWRAGFAAPSFDEPPLPAVPPVLINELLSASVPPQTDTIELYNPNATPVDIGGWYITDDFGTGQPFVVPLNTFVIPQNTVIPPGGFVTFTEADFRPGGGGTGFAFRSDSDEAGLFSADAGGNLTGYAHGFSFGAAEAGVSFGRHVTSAGGEHFVAQAAQTFGAANAGPKVGPVVISEIMYRPPDAATGDNSADEFIELLNVAGAPVALYDPTTPTNTWKLTEGVDFVFPMNVTLAAGEFALVVNFNPTDAAALAAFRAKYGVAGSVQIFGPYGGQLDNSGERVELKKPRPPVDGIVSYPLVDEVDYRDSAPWPAGADGFGLSLQRIDAAAYGNDPVNWRAGIPTAASSGASGGTAPVILSGPADQSVLLGGSALLNVNAGGSATLSYQWRLNGANIPGATGASLALPSLQAEQAGSYSVVVYNAYGSQVSSNAQLTIIMPAFIGSHPRGVTLRGSTNVADYGFTTNNAAFSASAASLNGAVSYQWRFNGIDVPGATSPVLTISNVNLSHDGLYDVVVTDAIGSAISDSARLMVLVNPIVVKPPLSQTVVEGSPFSQSVEVTGNPLPIAYSWRRGSVVIATNSGDYRSNFITLNAPSVGLILTNNILSSNYVMRLVVYNQANPSPGVLVSFTNTVLADFDRDGIPDVVENALGLAPGDASDAALDLDGDGVSNRAEYIAGTDPTNNGSYLKIDSIVAGGSATLTFGAVSNRTYSIEYTDALGAGPWSRLADVIARPGNRTETVVDAGFTTNRYYRVATPRQP